MPLLTFCYIVDIDKGANGLSPFGCPSLDLSQGRCFSDFSPVKWSETVHEHRGSAFSITDCSQLTFSPRPVSVDDSCTSEVALSDILFEAATRASKIPHFDWAFVQTNANAWSSFATVRLQGLDCCRKLSCSCVFNRHRVPLRIRSRITFSAQAQAA